MVALDARTGALRWETKTHDYKTLVNHQSTLIVVDGKVVSGRVCYQAQTREGCFIAAHDALTGKELWKFYATAGDDDPGGPSWGSVPEEKRIASPWGLPGSYDPVRKLLLWGIANPTPYSRLLRHNGNIDDVPRSAPADLYSNSTVALNPDNGKLVWYYQDLPGDDWDLDHTQERILLRTPFNPDPKAVKWINPKIPRGQERDVSVEMAEAGGIFVVDRSDGQFLWVTPFPYDEPETFNLSKVDVETGKTYINWDLVGKKEGERHIICFQNIKCYWPMAYHPGMNSLYIPYNDFCRNSTVKQSAGFTGWSSETVVRPGSDPNALGGFARVNMATGKVEWRYTQKFASTGGVLATAGDVVFLGDLNRRFRAFDAENGKILWETILGSGIQSSTITYAVNGTQYVAVLTGEGRVNFYGQQPDLKIPRGHNTIYVFALP